MKNYNIDFDNGYNINNISIEACSKSGPYPRIKEIH